MKRIGIDARLFSQTGVGTYLQNFLHYVPQFLNSTDLLYVYILKDDVGSLVQHPQIHPRIVTQKWHSITEQTGFLYELMKDNLDLMHFTYFSYPVLYRRPFIAT